MTKKEYIQYLQSLHWKAFKRKVYSLVRNCAACGSREKLNIHHINYGKLGRETLDDVVVLCRVCHTHLHNSEKMGFSRERWIKLHCKNIHEFRKQVKKDKRAQHFENPLLERAWRSALSYYAKQRNSRAMRELMRATPKKKKLIKSIPKAWKKAHRVIIDDDSSDTQRYS